jgi:hypothetical protein
MEWLYKEVVKQDLKRKAVQDWSSDAFNDWLRRS